MLGWGEASSAPTMTGETVEGLVAATNFMAQRLEGTEIQDQNQLVTTIEPLMVANPTALNLLLMEHFTILSESILINRCMSFLEAKKGIKLQCFG